MSKAPIYVVARAGGRQDRETVRRCIEHFVSTGSAVGSAELIAEVMNYCLEKRWAFTTRPAEGGVGLHIQRA